MITRALSPQARERQRNKLCDLDAIEYRELCIAFVSSYNVLPEDQLARMHTRIAELRAIIQAHSPLFAG